MARKLLMKWPLGSYAARLDACAVERPAYGFCLYHAAVSAKALGFKSMTAIEMGVAGGNGILNMCSHTEQIEREVGIKIHIVGFDSGEGLPPTTDVRDVQYYWPPGAFPMDLPALERRLAGRAELIFGDVADTVVKWEPKPESPIGAILFDLDLYSSTTSALKLLVKKDVLPRVWCYFDDIIGYPVNAFADGTGEREAIRQFNMAPERETMGDIVSRAHVFKSKLPEPWHPQIYLYHRLKHPMYNQRISGSDVVQALALRA